MGPSRRVAATFVAGQFLLLVVVFALPQAGAWPLPAWLLAASAVAGASGLLLMLIAAVRLGPSLTAMPIPTRTAQLATDGLYAWMRHPIYSGLLLLALARTLAAANWWTVAACLALIAWMTAKARWEEARLAERFPDYPEYARRTGRFIPRWR